MQDDLISPQCIYERLISEASDNRRKRSLDGINECCRLLSERGASDFSYRAIVTLGKDRGLSVPSEKSIVNPTGEHYRELIHAWRLVSPTKAIKTKINFNNWIERIEDPADRMSATMMAKELRAMKAKEARKAEFKGGAIIIGSGMAQALLGQPRFNDAEMSALKAAIDPSVLSLIGLSIGTRGEVTDVKGRVIHKPGFRDAIEKILAVQIN